MTVHSSRLSSNSEMDEFRTFDVLIKPVGAACNLRCTYCYFLDKGTSRTQHLSLMDDDMLEMTVREILQVHGSKAVVRFNWHGGEPLLAGLTFFEKAMDLQAKYGRGRKIINTIQTNGTTLNEENCQFLKRHNFSVGISIDGTRELHNHYRGNSFDKAMAGLQLLRKYDIEYAILCTVNNCNSSYPEEVYRFLRQCGSYIQFLPVVEAIPTVTDAEKSQRFATPPGPNSHSVSQNLCDFSVSAEAFGDFITRIYSIWNAEDSQRISVQLFDTIRQKLAGRPCSLCTMDMLCGHSASIDFDGKVYSCDRFQFSEYLLGNIRESPLSEILERNRNFGMYKTLFLPGECIRCEYVRLCAGGCPKDRLVHTCDRKLQNILCKGYKQIFSHILSSHRQGLQ